MSHLILLFSLMMFARSVSLDTVLALNVAIERVSRARCPVPFGGLMPEILAAPHLQPDNSAAVERACRRAGYWGPLLNAVIAIDLTVH